MVGRRRLAQVPQRDRVIAVPVFHAEVKVHLPGERGVPLEAGHQLRPARARPCYYVVQTDTAAAAAAEHHTQPHPRRRRVALVRLSFLSARDHTGLAAQTDTVASGVLWQESFRLDCKAVRAAVDAVWSRLLGQLIAIAIRKYEISNWLSTLGGGHSALGDGDAKHALAAQAIACRHWRFALVVEDVYLAARCAFYVALSFVQLGQCDQAERVFDRIERFAASAVPSDSKLLRMCLAGKEKLRLKREELGAVLQS
eukprot:m.195636 g.195636  ORF g.195636 m.195636 type:complete len:255 (-) comp21820_c0_seq1:25-789(-)